MAKVGIFKGKNWINLVKMKLMSDNYAAFSFCNARVVLKAKSSNSKKKYTVRDAHSQTVTQFPM